MYILWGIRMINWIFSKIWRRRLKDDFTGRQYKVVKVTGWRTAIVDSPSGNRMHTTFLGVWKWQKKSYTYPGKIKHIGRIIHSVWWPFLPLMVWHSGMGKHNEKTNRFTLHIPSPAFAGMEYGKPGLLYQHFRQWCKYRPDYCGSVENKFHAECQFCEE